MADPRTLQVQQIQKNDKPKAHEAGCTCNACTGKTDAISDILQGKVAIEQALKKTGHDAGCQCDACSGKTNAINDILGEPVKLDAAPKMAGHEPGCQCDSCQGKSNAVNDILKGNVIADSGPKIAGHEPGCQCDSCTGKANVINDLLNGAVKVDSTPKMAGHEPGCQCDSCSGKTNTINALLFVPPKVDISTTKDSTPTQSNATIQNNGIASPVSYQTAIITVNLQSNRGRYNESGVKNELSVQQFTSTAEMLKSDQKIATNACDARTSTGEREPAYELKQSIKDGKQFVIGNYTYMDILTIPWLRRQYGYMIGLGVEEEGNNSIRKEGTERATSNIIEPKKTHHQDDEVKDHSPQKSGQPVKNPKNDKQSSQSENKTQVENVKPKSSEAPTAKDKVSDERKSESRITSTMSIKSEIVSLRKQLGGEPGLKSIIQIKSKCKQLEISLIKTEEELKKMQKAKLKHIDEIKLARLKVQKLKIELKSLKKEIKTAEIKHETKHILSQTEKRVKRLVLSINKAGSVSVKSLRSMKISELNKVRTLLRNKTIIRFLMLNNSKSRRSRMSRKISGIIRLIRGILGS